MIETTNQNENNSKQVEYQEPELHEVYPHLPQFNFTFTSLGSSIP